MFNPLDPENREALLKTFRRSAPYSLGWLGVMILFWWLGPEGESVWVVPVLSLAGLWLLLNGLSNRTDQRALDAHVKGQTPAEGAWTVVCGKAVALEDSARQGLEDILAYRLEIYDRFRRGISAPDGEQRSAPDRERWDRRYDGYYLAPTGIQTPQGTVRLVAFPDMIHTPKSNLSNDLMVHAKETARLLPDGTPDFVAREKIIGRDIDHVDDCVKYGDHPETSATRAKCWQLRRGDEVCVFGFWYDGRLMRDPNRQRGAPLYQGSAAEVLAEMAGIAGFLKGSGGILLALAAAWAAWALI